MTDNSSLSRREDALFQAIPLSEIQGRVFYFGRHQKSQAQALPTFESLAGARVDSPRLDKPYDVEFRSSALPRPGATTYRIWAAIEKLVSDGGRDFDGRLQFSSRSLCRLAGLKWGGATSKKAILQAMEQLELIRVHHWRTEVTKDEGAVEDSLVATHFDLMRREETIIDTKSKKPKFYVIRIDDRILKFLQEDHYFFCMSSSRIAGLEPQAHSVARILYRYLSYRYSSTKSTSFVYTKDYATMCREWFGGVSPLSKPADIKRKHLESRFEPIKKIGIISSYRVEKNRSKDKPGFNIIIRPGKALFEDIKAFYSPQMTLPLSVQGSKELPFDIEQEDDLPNSFYVGDDESSASAQALALLHHFARGWFNQTTSDHATFTDAELRYAHELLKSSNPFEAKAFVDFGITEARNTGFKMATFNGLKTYRRQWGVERDRATQRMEREVLLREQEHVKELENKYEKFINLETERLRSALSEEGLAEIIETITAQQELNLKGSNKFLSERVIESKVNIYLRQNDSLPTFEEWSETMI